MITTSKKILLVSSAFYPEVSPRSFRATELAKEFCRQGHMVTVISKFRDHNYTNFLKEYPIKFKMWTKPVFPKLPEFRQKHLSFFSRGISRLLAVYFEYPAIEELFKIKRMLKKESDYDLMISFAVPYTTHWGVAWAMTMKNLIAETWVADCGDPYMGDRLDSFRKPFYFGSMEKWFCRKANYISIPVESARFGYYSEFHHKIKIIPQGFDFDLTVNQDVYYENEIPEFAYAGGFLKGIRDPELLMQFLIKITIPFKFYVFTDNPDLLNKYSLPLKGKLMVSAYVARNELMKTLLKMDFLINFDNNTTLNVPSKLIDYAIVNRPVLNIDKNFSFEKLLAFLTKDYSGRMILPNPEKYHIKHVSQQFIELL